MIDYRQDGERLSLKLLDEHLVDRLVVAGAFLDPQVVQTVKQRNIAFVVERYLPSDECHSVMADNVTGGWLRIICWPQAPGALRM